MTVLLIGLAIFLGVHSVRIVAESWRGRTVARIGPHAWRGLYSLLSIAGFALLIWGYGLARQQPVLLWTPPVWARHLAALLVLAAFVLVAAAYVPGNAIKARLHHPMILGIKAWAFAHLLANRTLAAELTFAAFLIWALFDFRAARRRDAANATTYPPGRLLPTLLTLAIGAAAWAAFAFWAHGAWIGVRPFG